MLNYYFKLSLAKKELLLIKKKLFHMRHIPRAGDYDEDKLEKRKRNFFAGFVRGAVGRYEFMSVSSSHSVPNKLISSLQLVSPHELAVVCDKTI